MPPEVRAAALAAVQVGERPVLVVTPREWAIVQRSAAGIGFEGADLEPRERLRACADRFLRQLPARLAAADLPGARAVATALRDELEQLGTPIHFPPVPGPAARAPELLTSTLGAFGAVFGGEAAVDPEAALPRSASAPAPRGLDRIHGLFEPLLDSVVNGSDNVELVFPSMAIDWDQITDLKGAIRDACPDVDSSAFRSSPQSHQYCER